MTKQEARRGQSSTSKVVLVTGIYSSPIMYHTMCCVLHYGGRCRTFAQRELLHMKLRTPFRLLVSVTQGYTPCRTGRESLVQRCQEGSIRIRVRPSAEEALRETQAWPRRSHTWPHLAQPGPTFTQWHELSCGVQHHGHAHMTSISWY